MAKKFGKFVLFTALAGVAVAGAYYYLKQKENDPLKDFDDFDDDIADFFDDEHEEATTERGYVSLDRSQTSSSKTSAEDSSEEETSEKSETASSAEEPTNEE